MRSFVPVILLALSGCVFVAERHDDHASGLPQISAGNTNVPTIPLTVIVDTDQTMNADGGAGVGIFVEYAAGGHWTVWWTCDTNVTKQSCAFDVTVRSQGDFFTNAKVVKQLSDVLQNPDSRTLHATTRTTTNVVWLTFDSAPGETISVEGSVSGSVDPSFFFFVQDGQIRGNYTGTLTNPLLFRGSKP